MYLGIDLGTSNSAVVGNNNSDLKLFKTADGTDVLPSVININKQGHRFIGNRAYEQSILSPDNVAQGFKRLMGTNSPISFAASGQTLSPEECSTEIIRTLLGQVKTEAGTGDFKGAVVTIPAAFNQMQSEATLRAAAAAGLDKVGLLQEPIAAAMASISQSKNKSGQFLVYDLGGGTFDVALVQSLNGSVNIVAHEGINMLGGRDFDKAIVNAIVRPWLIENFSLPENFQTDPRFRRLVGIARFAAEKAKIELSATDKAVIFASDEHVRAQDNDGTDIYLSIEVTRHQIEELIADKINDSIALCRKIIKDNGYNSEDIDRIVLIGGPSKMPGIRTRVPQELGIPADMQTDPMTAVAYGAAIFAESREWGATGATSRKSSRGTATVKGKIEIRYDYPARTADDRAKIRMRPVGNVAGYRLQIDTEHGWTTGIVDIESDFTLEVPLSSRGDNQFRVTVYDDKGGPVPESGTVLTIVRTHASAAGIPAIQTIAVKVVSRVGSAERNELEPLVLKGTPLPAEGTKSFRAAYDLKGGDANQIAIELYQQNANVPEPELNLFVGSFVIRGDKELEKGEVLRKGSEIVIRWAMDDNGILNCSIDLPDSSKSFDSDKFYVSSAGHQNFEGDEGKQIADDVIDMAKADIEATEDVVSDEDQGTLVKLQERLRKQKEALEQTGDADTRRSVTEEARSIRQEISKMRHNPRNRAMVLKQELDRVTGQFDKLIRETVDDRITGIFDRLHETANSALKANNLNEAERTIDEMSSITSRELIQQPGYVIFVFKELGQQRHLSVDKQLHDALVRHGGEAIQAQNIDRLREVVRQMFGNLIQVGASDSNLAAMAGLMRG
jgi:molecular chaperone DnaK